jgi:hypothetical protein
MLGVRAQTPVTGSTVQPMARIAALQRGWVAVRQPPGTTRRGGLQTRRRAGRGGRYRRSMRIAALGDRDPAHLTHREIDATLALLGDEVDCGWVPTDSERARPRARA